MTKQHIATLAYVAVVALSALIVACDVFIWRP